MTKKTILMALFCAGISIAAFAQEEPGASLPEMVIDNTASITEEKDVTDDINDFLSSMGWTEGLNKKNGSKIFVSSGFAEIQAPRSDRNYASSRVIAFDTAMLEAKKAMAKFLATEIRTQIMYSLDEGSFNQSNVASGSTIPEDETTMLAKVKMLINAKLDAALRAEGIDPDEAEKEALAKAARKQVNDINFEKFTEAAALSFISGMQVRKSFEASPANKKGTIGVVAVWSPVLQKMAESMLGLGPVPPKVPKTSIREQIDKLDSKTLLTTFGVQQMLDEDGNYVLVSFGQDGALTDSATSANAAYNKAQLNAVANIRQFAGENVNVSEKAFKAENTKEFEVAVDQFESEYSNASTFRNSVTAVADKMSISGISPLKRWKATHPITGKPIYGVICTWSPNASDMAKELKKQLNERPKPQAQGSTGSASSTTKTKNDKEKELSGNSFHGAGADADDDAY